MLLEHHISNSLVILIPISNLTIVQALLYGVYYSQILYELLEYLFPFIRLFTLLAINIALSVIILHRLKIPYGLNLIQ